MNRLKGKIHIAKAQLGMEESDYRALLLRITGKDSCGKMQIGELEAVLKEMKRLGFVAKSPKGAGKKPPMAKTKQAMTAKIEAILSDLQLPWAYAHGMAKKMFGRERLEWLNHQELRKLLQALAVYQSRKRGK